MTSLSVLQSSWLYLYHLYQLWSLGKETNRCEWVNLRKLAVMHDFLTCDLNPSLSDSNLCHLRSIFSTFWNRNSNTYLGDSNHPFIFSFLQLSRKKILSAFLIHFWHSKSIRNDPKLINFQGFWPYLHFYQK